MPLLDLVRTYGRLMRLSLAPTAAADIAVGILWGTAGQWPAGSNAPWFLIAASLCVVHGAMILNDWSDRGGDSITRPDRPLPSGRVSAARALWLGAGLLAMGPLLASRVCPGLAAWTTLLAVLAAGYDLGLRGPVLGPLLLASCRGGNLVLGRLTGALLATTPQGSGLPAIYGDEPVTLGFTGLGSSPLDWAPALLYFAYVFFVSRLGRLEDDEDPRPLGARPRIYLTGAGIALLVAPLALLPRMGVSIGFGAALLLTSISAIPLLREGLANQDWDRARIGRNMGRALRRLLVFTASLALVTLQRSFEVPNGSWDGLWVGLCVLAGYPVSFALRRAFPPS